MFKLFQRKSSNWIQRHVSDEFVRSSRLEGYRARSAYKLIEIIDKIPQLQSCIMRPNSVFTDLGAAPGSWSQVLSKLSHESATILAIDRLPIRSIPKTFSITNNLLSITHNDIEKVLSTKLNSQNLYFDIVLSDICTDISGNSITDNARNAELWTSVLDFAKTFLKQNQHLVLKVFDSSELNAFKTYTLAYFKSIKTHKPKSSRSDSSERYLICLNKR